MRLALCQHRVAAPTAYSSDYCRRGHARPRRLDMDAALAQQYPPAGNARGPAAPGARRLSASDMQPPATPPTAAALRGVVSEGAAHDGLPAGDCL